MIREHNKTVSNEVNITQETYERSARINERPISDHIYYLPSYFSTSFNADKKRLNHNLSTFIRSDISSLNQQRPGFRTLHK